MSDNVYKGLYDTIVTYGIADEFVQTICNVLRDQGYSTEVDCAIFEYENNLFNGSIE